MKKIFYTSALLFTLSINAQTSIREDKIFIDYEKNYNELIASKEFIKLNETALAMGEKMSNHYESIINKDFNEWIEKNLSLTKFESVEEAKKLYNEMMTTSDILKEKSKELSMDENEKYLINKYGKEELKKSLKFQNQKASL